jgi:hypothetical protein
MSIRAQSAAAVSRHNSSQDENSDSDETQSISSQNSSADKNSQNFTSEDDQISSQNLSIISSSVIRQFIRSIFEDTIMSIINVLIKAKKIASLNESVD